MIVLQGNPISTNHIYKRHGHIIYMCKEGKMKKEEYQWQAKTQWKECPIAGPVEVEIRLFFCNKLRRDIDNWHKILLDSLTGIVWEDDCQIQRMTVQKFIDKDNPRIEINIKKHEI